MDEDTVQKTDIERRGLESYAPYLLNRVTHRYNQMLHAELKSVGLSVNKMRILTSLAVYGQLTVNELCIHAIAEQPTMSRTIDALEAEGLVSRSISAEDLRARLIALTPAGRAAFQRFWPDMSRTSGKLSEVLSSEEQATLVTLLTRVLTHIRND